MRVSCEDGRDFIRSAVSRVYDEPFPAYNGPKPSRMQEEKERKRLQKLAAEGKPIPAPAPIANTSPPRRAIAHFVMNLPDSAITFLDAFRGILADDSRNLSGTYEQMPMVHCHCFTRELEFEKAEMDIRQVRTIILFRKSTYRHSNQRVETTIGHSLVDDVSLHLVRSVAPNKEMYCISFRLPREVALMK